MNRVEEAKDLPATPNCGSVDWPGRIGRAKETTELRYLFRQLDGERKINLVIDIRDVALSYLSPAVVSKVPAPHFPEKVRAFYLAKGQSLDWNLLILGDTGVYAFCSAARDVGLTPSQRSALDLLCACTEAIEADAVSERLHQNILDGFAGLDSDDVVKGKNAALNPKIASKFPRGKGKLVTPEAVAQFVKDKLEKSKFESVVRDAAGHFRISGSTITRRIRAAREAGLLS